MTKEAFFDDIRKTVDDIINTDYVFNQKDYVPGVDDGNLTFGRGELKKGIELNTCVLYVDIRNSVALTQNHWDSTMGKVYSAFTACVLKIAKEMGTFVRNIIGDRVMIVFPSENCFTNAVDCAIYINQASEVINSKFKNLEFKCGIGIDYGRIRLVKVGIQANGDEKYENKGLVWVGKPANLASRLTDVANKSIETVTFHVIGTRLSFKPNPFDLRTSFPETMELPKAQDFTSEELSQSIGVTLNKPTINGFHSISSIKKMVNNIQYPPILMSETVYKEFSESNPNRNSVKQGYWKLLKAPIRDIDYPVYGGDVIWNLN